MGGYGSGGHNRYLHTVEACARIDAAMLRRAGFFGDAPPKGQWGFPFESRGERSCVLAALWLERRTMLALTIYPADGAQATAYRVPVSYTSCNYGQRRAWLHCPRCGRRSFKLFYHPYTVDERGNDLHIFHCRGCRCMSYDAWRARGFSKLQDRVMSIGAKMKRLGCVADSDAWDAMPSRRPGMHQTTYARYARRLHELRMQAWDSFADQIDRYMGYEDRRR
jgi:hypothetical protein